MWPFNRSRQTTDAAEVQLIAQTEHRDIANPTELDFSIFGVVPSLSGASVNPATAMRVPAVAAGVRAISEAVGILPLHAYAARAVWAMNRTTMGAIRKLKNTAGDYLWREPISEGNPATILGRPVREMPDMPDADATEIPLVFGDFGTGFRIFDRVNLSVLRDPYSQQTNGLVRFHARRRVGGGVTKAEAFKFLTMKA